MTSLPSLSLYPQKKKEKKSILESRKFGMSRWANYYLSPYEEWGFPLNDEQSEREEHDWGIQTIYLKQFCSNFESNIVLL